MEARTAADGPGASVWRALLLPIGSALGAALALAYALSVTRSGAGERVPTAGTPERAAEAFVEAYEARNWNRAAQLAAGTLRRSLEQRARSARLQGTRARANVRRLSIEESFLLERDRLRFAGELVADGTAAGSGWPVSVTMARHGDQYLAEALSWPKGAPPNER